ncbi:hypothetical protein ANCCAN_15679 [Ancylostoma caninum]|uniref:RING-type E3 ubiquitin transferase n=1 Tax=Ancylostoma caninum TaxID=29170 RepID=A0A368G213_ANCCA|nr:hypothetical protein ANCCAN_15679 [Ancylostoma caninum]
MSPDAVNSSRVLCRYFASGCCSQGERCSYSHDRSAPADNVCRYYLKGNCSYGTGCRYDHVRPKKEAGAGLAGGTATKTKLSRSLPKPAKLPQPGLNIDAAEFVPSWKRATSGGCINILLSL